MTGQAIAEPDGTDGARLPLDQASTLPAAYYTDPAIYAVEQDRVFGRSWLSVAREEDLSRPGDYVTYTAAGEPIVVVRGRDDEIRAFANVCRHRNTTILEGAGNAKALQCPYHLWTYGLDGRLIGAPDMAQAVDFAKDQICLPKLRVEIWHGWVFVNLDADAEPLAPRLTGLDDLCNTHGLASMRRVATLDFPSPWNWKISVENFAESYHHAGVHPQTLQTAYPGNRSWAIDNSDQPWLNLDHTSLVEDLEPFTASVVFPSHLFSIVRPIGMYWFRIEVLSVDHVDLQIQAFTIPELSDDQQVVELLTETIRSINVEDIAINARTQAGLRSRFAAPGRISHLEKGTWQFRRWLLEQLTPTGTP